ncbi:UNVERIFIED_CONTAM: hypothetical protein NCL1_39772 [Trichonephila clavipes]
MLGLHLKEFNHQLHISIGLFRNFEVTNRCFLAEMGIKSITIDQWTIKTFCAYYTYVTVWNCNNLKKLEVA